VLYFSSFFAIMLNKHKDNMTIKRENFMSILRFRYIIFLLIILCFNLVLLSYHDALAMLTNTKIEQADAAEPGIRSQVVTLNRTTPLLKDPISFRYWPKRNLNIPGTREPTIYGMIREAGDLNLKTDSVGGAESLHSETVSSLATHKKPLSLERAIEEREGPSLMQEGVGSSAVVLSADAQMPQDQDAIASPSAGKEKEWVFVKSKPLTQQQIDDLNQMMSAYQHGNSSALGNLLSWFRKKDAGSTPYPKIAVEQILEISEDAGSADQTFLPVPTSSDLIILDPQSNDSMPQQKRKFDQDEFKRIGTFPAPKEPWELLADFAIRRNIILAKFAGSVVSFFSIMGVTPLLCKAGLIVIGGVPMWGVMASFAGTTLILFYSATHDSKKLDEAIENAQRRELSIEGDQ
jgi:hypothetical protein